MFSSSDNHLNAIAHRQMCSNGVVCDTPPSSRSTKIIVFDVATKTSGTDANDNVLITPMIAAKPRSVNKLIQQSYDENRNLSPITEISEHLIQSSLSDTPKRSRADLACDLDGE